MIEDIALSPYFLVFRELVSWKLCILVCLYFRSHCALYQY